MRKLIQLEKEKRIIDRIFRRIKNIEKDYSIDFIKRACNQYYIKESEKKRLQMEIKYRERELEKLKKRNKGDK